LSGVKIFQLRAEYAALRAGQVNGAWGIGQRKDLRGYAVASCP
jgi:hypothetical protein